MRYFEQDCQAWLNESLDYLSRLVRDLSAVAERTRFEAMDGFAASSPGLGGGRGAGAYSDRTAQVATMKPMADPILANAKAMRDSIHTAVKALRVADSARAQALPSVPPLDNAGKNYELLFCENCGTKTERLKNARCGSCYQFLHRNGRDRVPKNNE